ncbi:MAG: hypothetical protein LBK46_02250 [Oscillospiraceae bacterium]|jgi:hypothetical protein|nr:hypothetical protein [Oscillospiraceae bacterium]
MKDGKQESKWVELQIEGTEVERTRVEELEQGQEYAGSLYIEYGVLHITADDWYPVESLAALPREVCAACWVLRDGEYS